MKVVVNATPLVALQVFASNWIAPLEPQVDAGRRVFAFQDQRGQYNAEVVR